MSSPRNLRELVVVDLLRAQRLIRRTKAELDPQFRIVTPTGDYWIAMTLAEGDKRREQLRLLSDLMALLTSAGFIMASEVKEPDALCCVGLTHKEAVGAMCRIERKPLNFGQVEWMSAVELGEEIASLLPRGSRTLSAARISEAEAYFGPGGRFPFVKVGKE
jgi:hypothetical protein